MNYACPNCDRLFDLWELCNNHMRKGCSMTDTRFFEPDGGPRYGSMTQEEWYKAVRQEIAQLLKDNRIGWEELLSSQSRVNEMRLKYNDVKITLEQIEEAHKRHLETGDYTQLGMDVQDILNGTLPKSNKALIKQIKMDCVEWWNDTFDQAEPALDRTLDNLAALEEQIDKLTAENAELANKAETYDHYKYQSWADKEETNG